MDGKNAVAGLVGALALGALLCAGCIVEDDLGQGDVETQLLELSETDTVAIDQALWNPHNPQGQLFVEARSAAGNAMDVYYWDPVTVSRGAFIGALSDSGTGFFNPSLGAPAAIEVITSQASAVSDVVDVGEP